MKFEIYHQLGHNGTWNIDSIKNENTGEGIIISPRSMNKKNTEKIEESLRKKAIFDPLLLNPHQVNTKMATYDFYPNDVMPYGFETKQFSQYSSIIANKCIKFQDQNDFRYFVIPTRYYNDMPPVSTLTRILNEHFIDPFLTAIENLGSHKGVIIQLILNSNMIKNDEYASDLLNWITGIEGIDGVYLITELSPRDKQIGDVDFLYSLLNFVNALSQNELEVILGYLNTEALLLSIANPSIITIGSYENTRNFNSNNFIYDNEKTGQKGPTPRLYIPRLLDWIEHPYIDLMNKTDPDYIRSAAHNEYLDQVLKPGYKWHFTKPEPYKHFFIEGYKQLREISIVEDNERYCEICNIIDSATREYSQLKEAGFELGVAGSYLPKWSTAAHLFAKKQGWRK